MTLQLTRADDAIGVSDGDVDLLRYVLTPDSPQREAPKPYLDPIRTRAGLVVSLSRPWDHVWHKGLAWSLPAVDQENFWGGPSYVHGQGYLQLPNDGTQRHLRTLVAGVEDDTAMIVHDLEWLTQRGARMFTERRSLAVRILDRTAWALTFETAMTNATDERISIGSPTTRGRPNAGYGGLFWRGPRSFTDGRVIAPDAVGTGAEMRGGRHEWMAYEGRHDVVDATSLIVIADAAENPHHPPQWFARSEEYAALNPAPFFSRELAVPAGESMTFRYAVGIADAGADDAARIAAELRRLLAAPAQARTSERTERLSEEER